MIKAIFFDIDGTLVSFNTHRVPQSTIDALIELRKRKIKIFIATGRSLAQIDNLDGVDFDGYITFNGSYCVTADHQVIHKGIIPKEDIDALIRYQEEKESFPCSFMTKDEITVNYVNDRVRELARMVDVPIPPVRSLREAARNEVIQANLYVDKAKEDEIMQIIFPHCEASRWNPIFADINVRGNNKQTGIDKVIGNYGIRLDETMAFGDGGNDISMLRHVAIGIAMGNASDEVKQAADYTTENVDEDGIWKALKHFNIIN